MKVSKKVGLLGVFLASAAFAYAQTNPNPAWTTSKDVQKVANKKLFEDESLRASHIQARPVSPTWVISKGVHRTEGDKEVAQGNVESKGIPTWTISKGVQRIGRK